ncbi:hypothetical protein ESCO106000_08915 [Escherichia coli]|nr:hypothetical protein ExPECSC057_02419 [Escherichia coli]GDD40570.1 hypothetical protein HmCmsJML212_04514 [Escherichia coli]GDU16603.1 hypothetical protein BvCmsSINP032_00523 [Escherichia coli]
MLLIVTHPPYLNNRFKTVIEKNEISIVILFLLIM